MRPAYGAEEIRIGQHLLTIVVDVANVMGSRPDGWWRDRAGAAVRLHAELVGLAASGLAASGLTASGLTASGRPVLPDEAVPPGTATPDAPPGFVMVLEGAAKAAAARIAPTVSPDGSVRAPEPGQVTVVQAPGSGDDAIVAVVRALTGHRVVVTADRELRDRCVDAGATILRPGWLLGLLRP